MNKQSIKWVILAGLMLCGVGLAADMPDQTIPVLGLSSAEKDLLKTLPNLDSQIASSSTRQWILSQLVDPDSAKFSDLSFVRGEVVPSPNNVVFHRMVGWFGCGSVNAKNRMGGYNGSMDFFVFFSPGSSSKVEDGWLDDPEGDKIGYAICGELQNTYQDTDHTWDIAGKAE